MPPKSWDRSGRLCARECHRRARPGSPGPVTPQGPLGPALPARVMFKPTYEWPVCFLRAPEREVRPAVCPRSRVGLPPRWPLGGLSAHPPPARAASGRFSPRLTTPLFLPPGVFSLPRTAALPSPVRVR